MALVQSSRLQKTQMVAVPRRANLIVLGARTFKAVMGGEPEVMWHQRGSCINRPFASSHRTQPETEGKKE